MKITNGKDFWAGLMFIAFGLSFMYVAQNYAMGSSVRMGPAYFPTVLGGMLAVLGGVVFLRAFVSKNAHPLRVFPFRIWYLLVGVGLGVVAFYTQPPRDASVMWQISHMVLAGLAVGLIFAAFGERSLWVILFAVVIFGYMLKPLGLVIATGLLVFVSAWGGHEFKVKEVTILFVALAIFSVYAFVKGLGLPMNVWPAFLE
jgi:Tripartite tricarboxylate transporter TctB family